MIGELIEIIEQEGYHWDVANTSGLREARIWDWPNVKGRYRTNENESPFLMLSKALIIARPDLEQKVKEL